MNPSTFIPALLIALLSAGSYWAGDHHRNNAWLAKQVTEADANKKALDDEIERSRKAAETHLAEQQQLMKSYSTLEDKFNAVIQRGPLVVYRAAAAASGVVSSGASGGASFVDAGNADKSEKSAGDGPGLAGTERSGAADLGADLGLSLGAVWVWNSALIGSDSPIGGCGATDTTGQTCAADSGISIEAAWQNHIDNAKSCAIDRLRHQRLIDYIQAHEPKGEKP